MFKKMVSKIIIITIICGLIFPTAAFACGGAEESTESPVSYMREKISGYWNRILLGYDAPEFYTEKSAEEGFLTKAYNAAWSLTETIYEGFVGFFSLPEEKQA